MLRGGWEHATGCSTMLWVTLGISHLCCSPGSLPRLRMLHSLTRELSNSSVTAPRASFRIPFREMSRTSFSVGMESLRMSHHSTCRDKEWDGPAGMLLPGLWVLRAPCANPRKLFWAVSSCQGVPV